MLEIVEECFAETRAQPKPICSPSTDLLHAYRIKFPYYYRVIKDNVDLCHIIRVPGYGTGSAKDGSSPPGGDLRLYRPNTGAAAEARQSLSYASQSAYMPAAAAALPCCAKGGDGAVAPSAAAAEYVRGLIHAAFAASPRTRATDGSSGGGVSLTEAEKGVEVTGVFLRNVPLQVPRGISGPAVRQVSAAGRQALAGPPWSGTPQPQGSQHSMYSQYTQNVHPKQMTQQQRSSGSPPMSTPQQQQARRVVSVSMSQQQQQQQPQSQQQVSGGGRQPQPQASSGSVNPLKRRNPALSSGPTSSTTSSVGGGGTETYTCSAVSRPRPAPPAQQAGTAGNPPQQSRLVKIQGAAPSASQQQGRVQQQVRLGPGERPPESGALGKDSGDPNQYTPRAASGAPATVRFRLKN